MARFFPIFQLRSIWTEKDAQAQVVVAFTVYPYLEHDLGQATAPEVPRLINLTTRILEVSELYMLKPGGPPTDKLERTVRKLFNQQ